VLPESEGGERDVQAGSSAADSPSGSGRADHRVGFGATLVIHLVYDDAASAAVAGHRQHGHANATVKDRRWFESKDAFMGVVCKAFEQFWDEMKLGTDGEERKAVHPESSG